MTTGVQCVSHLNTRVIPRSAASRNLLFSFAFLLMFAAFTFSATKPIIWKPAKNTFLRVNDQPVKDWDAFEIEKKSDRYLLELEGKFLLIDTQLKQVFELPQKTVQRQGSDLSWDPETLPQKPIATSNWNIRDVGL